MTGGGGGEGGRVGVSGKKKKMNPLLSYMHMAVHQLIAEGKKIGRKLVYSPPCGGPVFLCEPELHYFIEMRDGRGWFGVGGVMSV